MRVGDPRDGGMLDVSGPVSSFGNAHPILIVGIMVFVVPFLTPIMGWTAPKFIGWLGIMLILVGALLSIVRLSR
jgi:putative Mn2+ efflux pump MntP